MVKFFNHLFGKNKKNNDDEESPFLPKETEPIELIFAKNFTKKGGKFLYCENKNEVLQYFDEILIENNWTLSSITCKNDFLIDYFGLIKLNNKDIIDAEIITCEFLVANKGSILVSSNQISTKKLNEISENLIVFAKNSQFSSDVSESMSLLNSKYETKPTNITTINAFDTKSEIDFLSYGRTSKNLYLIVQE